MYYILEDRKVRPASMSEWSEMFNRTFDRRVGYDEIGEVHVSTVFMGLDQKAHQGCMERGDHQFGDGDPLLFETMIFGGEHDDYQVRTSTWEKAERAHQDAIALVKGEKT